MAADMIPHSKIRSALRKLWMWSPQWTETKRRARVQRGVYRCQLCGHYVNKVEVDHVVPCGPTPGSRNADPEVNWDCWISRLFLGELQAVCPPCHQKRTHAKEGAA